MNILFYTNFSPYGVDRVGGAEMSLKTIAEMMVNHGHQSYFISKGGRRTLFKLTERKKINDVEVIFINKIGFPTFKISQLKKLNKFLNEKAFNNY
ncbi:MAG: hypothetical protein RBT61_09005, partial [Candidatus Kapabacteria bacterium]|nr:hypothetical protein [Candidatus Kapabacteria bacterium]